MTAIAGSRSAGAHGDMGKRMNDLISGAILGAVIGNALGLACNGMSKGHVAASFRGDGSYPDPGVALKNRMEQWKKPGLYGSTAQMMMIAGISAGKGRNWFADFSAHAATGAVQGEGEWGVFRHPWPAERIFLRSLRNAAAGDVDPGPGPIADASPGLVLLPLALSPAFSAERLMLESVNAQRAFTSDISCIAAGAMLLACVRRMSHECGAPLLETASLAAHELCALAEGAGPGLFSLRVNPDEFATHAHAITRCLDDIMVCRSADEAEKTIIAHASPMLKTAVRRATVNHPALLAPYGIFLCAMAEPGEALWRAFREGGAGSLLCMIAGAITGVTGGIEALPEKLRANLVNKNRVAAIAAAAQDVVKRPLPASEFIGAEAALTAKENEELAARTRHLKPREKKPKQGRDRERDLSRHVIESWTKLDRAKWKKQQRKEELDGED